MKKVLDRVKTTAGHNTRKGTLEGAVEKANKLNEFFQWFDLPITPQPSTQLPS